MKFNKEQLPGTLAAKHYRSKKEQAMQHSLAGKYRRLRRSCLTQFRQGMDSLVSIVPVLGPPAVVVFVTMVIIPLITIAMPPSSVPVIIVPGVIGVFAVSLGSVIWIPFKANLDQNIGSPLRAIIRIVASRLQEGQERQECNESYSDSLFHKPSRCLDAVKKFARWP